jgi:hypothetical protein
MSEDRKGIRARPAALTLAFVIWFVMIAVRFVFLLTAKEPWSAVRFNLVSEGTGLACEVLAVIGAFELARRLTGREALGARVAAIGFAVTLAIDLSYGALAFMNEPWRHEWIYKSYDYAFFLSWLAVPVGLAIACWRTKRELGIFCVVISLLTWPPAFLRDVLYGWLPDGKAGWTLELVFRVLRLAVFLAAYAAIARGGGSGDRSVAASGLRTASTALWLRVIAAVGVVLLTLMLVAGKGGRGSFEILRLAMMAGAIINIFALAQFGVGALRAARTEVADLGWHSLTLAGAASLWGCGVSLGQLPWMYKMLYKAGDSGFGGRDTQEWAQALSLAMPLVVTIGVMLVGFAISNLAAKRGNDDLRADAQAKNAGFVLLTLVALAITQWIIPKAMRGESLGTFVVLSLLGAAASLVATVLMAKLLGRGAQELESEPGLPKASVVTDGS